VWERHKDHNRKAEVPV